MTTTSLPDEHARIATRYRTEAARLEARSPLRAALTQAIATDSATIAWLAELPRGKRQPVLLLAALQYACGTPPDAETGLGWLHERRTEVADALSSHRTQVNEPGRCAALLPLLAGLSQPLALIEVGASAGLCLLPDFYGYDYGDVRIAPAAGAAASAPILPCQVSGDAPLPARPIAVVWRVGLDLAPLNLRQSDDRRWLEAQFWPGTDGRLDRLRAAIAIAQRQPPRLVRGDLTTDLPALVAQAPRGATVVVYHSGVLPYVALEGRERFVATLRRLNVTWISNEPARSLPMITAPEQPSARRFLLSLDGRPRAWSAMDGSSLTWLSA